MTTKLDSPVTRLTTMVVDGREVDVTLRPADVATLEPDAIVFHQKGLKSEVAIPLPAILKAIGWKMKGAKAEDDREERMVSEGVLRVLRELPNALKAWKEAA